MIAILKPGILYFAIVFSIAFVFGIIRTIFVVPRIGERWAELAEVPFLLIVIFFAARWIVKKFGLNGNTFQSLAAGIFAAIILLIFEFSLVLFLRGISITQFLTERDPVSGTAYYLAVLIFALAPTYFSIQPKLEPSS